MTFPGNATAVFAAALLLSSAFAPTKAQAGPVTLISHTGTLSTTVALNGFGSSAFNDSPTDPSDPEIFSYNRKATGTFGKNYMFSGADNIFEEIDDSNSLITATVRNVYRAYKNRFGSGGSNVGGNGNTALNASMEFVLNATDIRVDRSLILTEAEFAIQLLNVTTNQIILDVTQNSTGLTDSILFTGSVGDILRYSYSGSTSLTVNAGAPSDFTIRNEAKTTLNFVDVTPASQSVSAPGALALLGFGLLGLGMRRRTN